MWERRSKGQDIENYCADLGKSIPLARFGEAEEHADLVAFLVSAKVTQNVFWKDANQIIK